MQITTAPDIPLSQEVTSAIQASQANFIVLIASMEMIDMSRIASPHDAMALIANLRDMAETAMDAFREAQTAAHLERQSLGLEAPPGTRLS